MSTTKAWPRQLQKSAGVRSGEGGMTFLQGCDHDVFVSYAHGPVPLGQYSTVQQDPLSKWTHKFVDDLRGNIDFLLGFKDPQRRVEIWMDPALEGNQPLGANLKGKVERSALLLVAMSHFYLQSEWCGKEVEWFSDRIDTDGHLFVARVCPTQQEWPKALKDKDGNELPGYRFHPATEPGQLCNPYGWPRPTEDDKEYQAELTRLAHAITKQLQRLKWIERQNGEGHDFTSVPPSVGRTLFLGFMHDTLSDNGLRGELRAALVDKGITVLPPEADEPYDEASLRNAIAKYLDQSHGLIVVANEYGGYWPRGEDGGFFGYQLREARERKIPSHPWLLVDDLSQVRNPQYQAFLRRFESEAADHSNTVRYKDAFSFIAHIGQKLNNQEAGRPSTPDALVCPVNNPDGEVYREFQEIVLDAVASTGRIIYSPPQKESALSSLPKFLEETNADTLVVLCFDQENNVATRLLSQLRLRVGSRPFLKAKLFVVGPEDKGKLIPDPRGLGFRLIDGIHTPPNEFIENLKNEIVRAAQG